MTSAEQEYMTASQVATLLGVTKKTVHNWIAAGKFPGAHKVMEGSNMPVLIPTIEVEALQKERGQSAN
jgi:excisionase family DNA binding protein